MNLLSHTRFLAAAALAFSAFGAVSAAPHPVYVQSEPAYSPAPFYQQRERGYRYQREDEGARGQPEWHGGEWQQHPRQWQQPHVQRWVPGRVYEAGSIVQYGGRLYIAKMWNAGSLPTPNQYGWSDWTPYRS